MSEEEILGHVRNAYRAEKNNFGTLEFNVYYGLKGIRRKCCRRIIYRLTEGRIYDNYYK